MGNGARESRRGVDAVAGSVRSLESGLRFAAESVDNVDTLMDGRQKTGRKRRKTQPRTDEHAHEISAAPPPLVKGLSVGIE